MGMMTMVIVRQRWNRVISAFQWTVPVGGLRGVQLGSLVEQPNAVLPIISRHRRLTRTRRRPIRLPVYCIPSHQLLFAVLRTREKISVAKEKRAAKTIAVIIFVFTFCWLPFFCAYVILPFCDSCTLHPKVSTTIHYIILSFSGQSSIHMVGLYQFLSQPISLWHSESGVPAGFQEDTLSEGSIEGTTTKIEWQSGLMQCSQFHIE